MRNLIFTMFIYELLTSTIAKPVNEGSQLLDFDGSYSDANDLVFDEFAIEEVIQFMNFLPLTPGFDPQNELNTHLGSASLLEQVKPIKVFGPEFLFNSMFFPFGSRNPFGPNFPFAIDDKFSYEEQEIKDMDQKIEDLLGNESGDAGRFGNVFDLRKFFEGIEGDELPEKYVEQPDTFEYMDMTDSKADNSHNPNINSKFYEIKSFRRNNRA